MWAWAYDLYKKNSYSPDIRAADAVSLQVSGSFLAGGGAGISAGVGYMREDGGAFLLSEEGGLGWDIGVGVSASFMNDYGP